MFYKVAYQTSLSRCAPAFKNNDDWELVFSDFQLKLRKRLPELNGLFFKVGIIIGVC